MFLKFFNLSRCLVHVQRSAMFLGITLLSCASLQAMEHHDQEFFNTQREIKSSEAEKQEQIFGLSKKEYECMEQKAKIFQINLEKEQIKDENYNIKNDNNQLNIFLREKIRENVFLKSEMCTIEGENYKLKGEILEINKELKELKAKLNKKPQQEDKGTQTEIDESSK